MIHMLGHAVFGLIVGIVARLLMPGAFSFGIIVTALIGIVGGWLGGWLGRVVGIYKEGSAVGFIMSVIGAMVLLLIVGVAMRA